MGFFLSHGCFQLREYCLRLRNMVASDATKAELSDAIDGMIEEASMKENILSFSCSCRSSLPELSRVISNFLLNSGECDLWFVEGECTMNVVPLKRLQCPLRGGVPSHPFPGLLLSGFWSCDPSRNVEIKKICLAPVAAVSCSVGTCLFFVHKSKKKSAQQISLRLKVRWLLLFSLEMWERNLWKVYLNFSSGGDLLTAAFALYSACKWGWVTKLKATQKGPIRKIYFSPSKLIQTSHFRQEPCSGFLLDISHALFSSSLSLSNRLTPRWYGVEILNIFWRFDLFCIVKNELFPRPPPK